ncbi:hypothetical protein AX17_005382 [Amanita inopinata Kibby_2008]|nr:hypothetical protein AX17_005382 [Amanita inopinata Kibby_2008]
MSLATAAHVSTSFGSYGALEIANTVNAFLFGLTFMQAYNYFYTFKDDSTLLKSTVFSALILAALHTVALECGVYQLNGLQHHADLALLKLPRPLIVATVAGQLGQFIVQALWVYRIHKLQHGYALPLILILPELYALGAGMTFIGLACEQTFGQLGTWLQEMQWLVLSQLATIAVIDIAVAVMLCYHLRKERASYLARTMQLIDTFVCKWTVKTGLITSVTAVGTLLAFVIRKDNGVWFCLYTCLMNLYPLTCIALLNGRSKIHAPREHVAVSSIRIARVSSPDMYDSQTPLKGTDSQK